MKRQRISEKIHPAHKTAKKGVYYLKQEKEVSGKTVEAAILNGAKDLGVDRNLVTYEIIEMPKKGFLGFGEVPARVRVFYQAGTECSALDFVNLVIGVMGLEAKASVSDLPGSGNGKLIKIEGEEAGVLIGHHGETLDSLQYLVNLVANKREEDEESHGYMKITIDIEDYRAKREATLRQLADRMAQKVLKYKKSVTLEPMNPYERRIIHSEIQGIEGVTTTSVGADNNRKIVIFIDDKKDGNTVRPGQTGIKNRRAAVSVNQDAIKTESETSDNTAGT
jgi:spoIIIJ-associated protein